MSHVRRFVHGSNPNHFGIGDESRSLAIAFPGIMMPLAL
jgi:hypothetical protein